MGVLFVDCEGLRQPLLDQLQVQTPPLHRAEGESLELSEERPVATGSFAPGNGWQEVKFGSPVTGRYLCLEALNAHDGQDRTCIAELYVLDEFGERLSREPWTVKYADSEEVKQGNRSADKLFDLQECTYWSTVKGTPDAHAVVIDLGDNYHISALQYLPRMESHVPGGIKDYRIYVKETPFKQ